MTAENHNNHNNGADVAAAIRESFRVPSDSEVAPGDASDLAKTYRNIMDDYRQHGQQYLTDGDYRQAAEKSWGAFAESVKSIAADYGMKISFHGTIVGVAGRLATLAAQDDPEAGELLRQGLGLARSLHQHFYEDDLDPDDVRFSSERVAAAIDLMQQRFSVGGGWDTVEDV